MMGSVPETDEKLVQRLREKFREKEKGRWWLE